MGKKVEPKVFLVGYTVGDTERIAEYLAYTKQLDFLDSWRCALMDGLSSGEALCSLYAKICYQSLVLGKNDNITRIRDIRSNLEGCFDTAHGSVFEHCLLNFVVTDCSRVYTHEQVRHRVGVAYSQTSGRYCRGKRSTSCWTQSSHRSRKKCWSRCRPSRWSTSTGVTGWA